MQLVSTCADICHLIKEKRSKGKTIGLVPTMGCFHEGHLTLMRSAKRQCGFVVVSLFVNPTQFGPNEDYEVYPRDLQGDAEKAASAGADVLFAPSVEEIYPAGFNTSVRVEGLTEVLCGRSRPGHFQGVTTIVAKLFNIVQPDRAFFGQKDGQQSLVIKRMTRDLNLPLEIEVVPTVREEDGLAMSSRNLYLNSGERLAATVLYRSLCAGRDMIEKGVRNSDKVLAVMNQVLQSEPLARVEYIEIRDQDTLAEFTELKGDLILALAVRIGKTRLIDNFMLQV